MSYSFILASSSPRRQELLRQAGFSFLVVPANIEEPHFPISPQELVQKLSQLKAEVVAEQFPDQWVLSADTLVIQDQHILGKPKTLEEANLFLTQLAGNNHHVLTAYTLRQHNQQRNQVIETRITFRSLSSEEIRAYIEQYRPLDKAGAYGIQEIPSDWVALREGSYTNVVGLPMESLLETFPQLGIFPQ